MKKIHAIILVFVMTAMTLAGCKSAAPSPEDPVKETITVENATAISEEEATQPEEVTGPEETTMPQEEDATQPEEGPAPEETVTAPAKGQPIVWLGDSLTQGSLGDDNDNLPNAPYEKLKAMAGVPVEGYGMYGYNTHDIFWTYKDESRLNQKRDPAKTYIFWVGSNDWVVEGGTNSETAGVIDEIDRFISDGVTIPNYIVVGTTARFELTKEQYTTINAALAEHYGDHYLDVIDVIGGGGYGDDWIHLKQESYDAVADAVYNKLIEMGYL